MRTALKGVGMSRMEGKFTKSKWEYGTDSDSFIDIDIKGTRCSVCRHEMNTDKEVFSRDEMKANAYLILQAPAMFNAMLEFCERVEKGEVKSKRTYNNFKRILRLATSQEILRETCSGCKFSEDFHNPHDLSWSSVCLKHKQIGNNPFYAENDIPCHLDGDE